MSRLVRLWRALNMPCREITRLASASLDRQLDPMERVALKSHQVSCRACRRYVAQMHFIRGAVATISERIETDSGLPGPTLPDDLRERILRSLRED